MEKQLRSIFPDAHAGELPATPGAYLLVITLDQPFAGKLRKQPYTLPAGTYLYAGSANGPGGIAPRVVRHMRQDKKPHWHVDVLTTAAAHITALAFPGGRECALVERLLDAECQIPLPGFGSSDCPSCEAHLLRFSVLAG